MFRLHCNKCYLNRDLEPALAFHFSRCHHILCASCLDAVSKDHKCPLCSLTLQTMPISSNMPSSIAQYFEDPNKILQLYRKISKFQCDQRASDNLGFWRQMQEEEALELQLEGYKKLAAQLIQQMNFEKMRIAELRAYLSYHEQKEPKRQISRRRPLTPCLSSSDESLGISFRLNGDMDSEPEELNLDKSQVTITSTEDSDCTV